VNASAIDTKLLKPIAYRGGALSDSDPSKLMHIHKTHPPLRYYALCS